MTKKDLRIIFMGTPEFAVKTLQALIHNGYNVVAVVTKPNQRVGRHGSVLQQSAVSLCALQHNLPVLRPEKLDDPNFIEQLRSYNANLQIVVAFSILPKVIWDMPKYGTFNVHASLLPEYRGAAPINWAIINGETETGVTTFFIDEGVDTGRIIMSKSFQISDTDNAENVHNGLMRLGSQVCLETLDKIISANGKPESIQQCVQNLSTKTAPKIFKSDCKIDWTKSAEQIYNFVRGLSPHPGAWTTLRMPNGKEITLKIYKTRKTNIKRNADSGTLKITKLAMFVSCDDEWLELLDVQQAGRKRMSALDFINGVISK